VQIKRGAGWGIGVSRQPDGQLGGCWWHCRSCRRHRISDCWPSAPGMPFRLARWRIRPFNNRGLSARSTAKSRAADCSNRACCIAMAGAGRPRRAAVALRQAVRARHDRQSCEQQAGSQDRQTQDSAQHQFIVIRPNRQQHSRHSAQYGTDGPQGCAAVFAFVATWQENRAYGLY
jgi:hypothetical protein